MQLFGVTGFKLELIVLQKNTSDLANNSLSIMTIPTWIWVFISMTAMFENVLECSRIFSILVDCSVLITRMQGMYTIRPLSKNLTCIPSSKQHIFWS